jgi:excisionase family DNA binding protein
MEQEVKVMNELLSELNLRLLKIEVVIRRLAEPQPPQQPPQQPEQAAENDLLSVPQAAKLLNLTVSTIYAKVHKKEIPYMKYGKKVRFSRKALLQCVTNGSVMSNEQIEQAAVAYEAKKRG